MDDKTVKESMIPTLKFVKSSNLVGVGYDAESKNLYVMFKSKKIYKYENVEAAKYQELKESSSAGSYFHKVIRSNHKASLSHEVTECTIADVVGEGLLITNVETERGYVVDNGIKYDLLETSTEAITDGSANYLRKIGIPEEAIVKE